MIEAIIMNLKVLRINGRTIGVSTASVVLAIAFAAIIGRINIPFLMRIVTHESMATATITRTDYSNHARVHYRFQIDGAKYVGSDSRGADCLSRRAGGEIEVYFDQADPSYSTSFEPRGAIWNEVITIALICLTFPPMIVWQLYLFIQKFR